MLLSHFQMSLYGLAVASLAGVATAQTYPVKPVRVVTSGLGGGADVAARLITPELSAGLGQQVVVDNRPSGVIPGEIVSRAQPDGYTLLVYTNSLWIGHFMRDVTPYNVVRDFSPVSIIDKAPMVLVVTPGLPAKSVKELIALAKSRPGQLNYGTNTTGSSGHLSGELFKSMGGIDIVRVPYKSTSTRLTDMIAGRVELSFNSPGGVIPYIKSGRLRALATTGLQPTILIMGLPTVAASGLPGFEIESLHGAFAPSGTPAAVIARLNREIVRVARKEEMKDRFLGIGVEPVGSTSAEFSIKIKSEMARMGKVIKDANIKGEGD